MNQQLSLVSIRTDGGTQPRAAINDEVVQDYAFSLMEGQALPPVTVFYDGTDYWLADGFHRYHAARQICRDEIDVDIKQGTRRDAVLYSAGANASHGLRRANEDKRRAVETLLNDAEWAKWSDYEIARRTATSHEFVRQMKLTSNVASEERTYITKHGAIATMNATNIGRSPVQTVEPPKPSAPAYTPPVYHAPASYTPPIQPMSLPSEEEEQDTYQWRYDPDTHEAYCKYCYNTHRLWEHFLNVFPGDHVWECQVCKHRMKDEFMQIESRVLILEDEEEQQPTHTPSGVPAALLSSNSNEWYTPALYIDAVRELMGGIDLDPASCEEANLTVQATRYYSEDDDGLAYDWWADKDETIPARVFLNPPYGFGEEGKSHQEIWAHRLMGQYEMGFVKEAVLLVNANTEAKWFQPLYKYLICLTNHRIRFYNADGQSSQPTQGNALVYFGKQKHQFIEMCNRYSFGTVIREAKADEY